MPEDIIDPGDSEVIRKELHDAGWLGAGLPGEGSLSGDNPMALSRAGTEHFASNRSITRYREREAQVRVLEYTRGHDGYGFTEDMVGNQDQDFTGKFTPKELYSAEKRLTSYGMIQGDGSASVEYLLRPEVTSIGQDCLDSGLAPVDFNQSQGGSTVAQSQYNNFHGTVGGVVFGDHNTQNVQQNISGTDLEEALRAVESIRELIEQHLPTEVETVDALEILVKADQPNTSTIQTLLGAAVGSAASAAGEEIAQLIANLGRQLMTSLGA